MHPQHNKTRTSTIIKITPPTDAPMISGRFEFPVLAVIVVGVELVAGVTYVETGFIFTL